MPFQQSSGSRILYHLLVSCGMREQIVMGFFLLPAARPFSSGVVLPTIL